MGSFKIKMREEHTFVIIMTLGGLCIFLAFVGIVAYTCVLRIRVRLSERTMDGIVVTMQKYIESQNTESLSVV